jgi:MFS family permease
MDLLNFFAANRRLLSVGIVTAFSSSFGQTFLISLFLPHLLREFNLTRSEFGMLYALSTLLGAIGLAYLGRLIDSVELRRYTSATVLGMSGAAFIVGSSHHVAMLGIGILGLRLTGQGLLSHISHTVMARDVPDGRGKALGIAGLGYPLGEGVLPVGVVFLIAFAGWRMAWTIIAIAAAFILLPVVHALMGKQSGISLETSNRGDSSGDCADRPFARDSRFYLLMPAVLVLPFMVTALFLYQSTLAESRGWSAASVALAFIGYAIARAASSVAVGPIIDKYSGLALLPIYLLPITAAVLLLLVTTTPLTLFFYLFLIGLSTGSSGSVSTAVWAEVYGPRQVGSVRSIVSSVSIISTSASALLLGYILDAGVQFDGVVIISIVLMMAASAAALVASGRAR